MVIKIIFVILAVICAVIALTAQKILSRILKREPDEKEVVLLKAVMLLACFAIAAIIVLPDMI